MPQPITKLALYLNIPLPIPLLCHNAIEKNVDPEVGGIAYLDSELSLWEVHRSLLGLLQLQLLLVLCKTSTDSTSLL